MGQENGRTVDRNSAEYQAAQERFNVVTDTADIVRTMTTSEREAARLLTLVRDLPESRPLLPSSDGKLGSAARDATIAELTSSSTSSSGPVAGLALASQATVRAAAMAQTADFREGSASIAFWEDALAHLANAKYSAGYLRYHAGVTSSETLSLSKGIAEHETSMSRTLEDLRALCADVAALAVQVDALVPEDDRVAIQNEANALIEERRAMSPSRAKH